MAKPQPKLKCDRVIVTELADGRLAIDIPEDSVTLVYSCVGADGVGKVSIEFAPERGD